MNLLSADLETAVNRTVKLAVSGGNFWKTSINSWLLSIDEFR